MKWIAAVVIVDAEPIEPAVDLISSLFDDLGLSGVVVEDPDLEPPEGWGEDALPKPEHHSVTGYFPQNDSLASNCSETGAGTGGSEANIRVFPFRFIIARWMKKTGRNPGKPISGRKN